MSGRSSPPWLNCYEHHRVWSVTAVVLMCAMGLTGHVDKPNTLRCWIKDPPPPRFVWYVCQCWQTDRMWCEWPPPVSFDISASVDRRPHVVWVPRHWPAGVPPLPPPQSPGPALPPSERAPQWVALGRPATTCWWNGQLRVSRSRHVSTTTASPGEITQWRRGRWAAGLDSLEEFGIIICCGHCLCDSAPHSSWNSN